MQNQDIVVDVINFRGRRAAFLTQIHPDKAYELFIKYGGNMSAAHKEYDESYGKISATKFKSIFRIYVLENHEKCKQEINDLFTRNHQFNALFSDIEWEQYLVSCIRNLVPYYYGYKRAKDKTFLKQKVHELGDKLGHSDLVHRHFGA